MLGAPEHVNSPYHKDKLASPRFILLGRWNDWSWIGNTNLSPILCLGQVRTLRSSILQTYNTSCLTEKNSIIITFENCVLQLTSFRCATFKVKLRKIELPATAARALNSKHLQHIRCMETLELISNKKRKWVKRVQWLTRALERVWESRALEGGGADSAPPCYLSFYKS